MRGEFIRGDGLVTPNNVTLEGSRVIMAAAFRNEVPTFYLGLVRGMSNLNLTLADVEEPTIGVNGYARQQITRDATGWPVLAVVGNEQYIESQFYTFTASGGAFDRGINRMALFTTSIAAPNNKILALSAAMASTLLIDPSTDVAFRRFQYRFYL